VFTRGRQFLLSPQVSGETLVESKPCKRNQGTRVEVRLGTSIPDDPGFLNWAKQAIEAAGDSAIYSGKTSPHWFDSDSIFELFQAAGRRTVSEVLAEFDDCQVDKIDKQLLSRRANSLNYREAEKLLKWARDHCQPVPPTRFALLGDRLDGYYAKFLDTLTLPPGRGTIPAELPYTVEAWCDSSCDEEDQVYILVNRTPVATNTSIRRAPEKAEVIIYGCNLRHRFKVGRKPVVLTINVQIPYVPIMSNGKAPNLETFIRGIWEVVEKAAKKCQRDNVADPPKATFLPSSRRGRQTDDDKEKYDAEVERFANRLKEINAGLDFKPGARGWCYILENERLISKGDFDKTQKLITECRKNGLLPIDFTAEDDTRSADNVEDPEVRTPEEYAVELARSLHEWGAYSPGSFWDNQPVYIQMAVEKIDLKSLFSSVCLKYHVPIINVRGWSDLHSRAGMMRRFQEHEKKGRKGILLYCGDLDPKGLQMSDYLLKNFRELEHAVGWSPDNLAIERFGLNIDFINKHDLPWIDGLETSGGKDLGDPNHREHNADFVQEYIAQYGERKVEANALVVRPEAGRQLCREAIEKHLDMAAIPNYERSFLGQREKVRRVLPDAIKTVLAELEEGEKAD
jgi:hypothetical protein